ncbi:cytochrome C [Geomonas sp. RF6]|uniref:cytochrome c3 family protein n=1 Tax=Geomonas sp. RF6 TaxID=2897342 RepID=UPI001E42F8B0|nr:cytochrome c3 family protein [Geomonas sp. RF6]UFS71604.1 cytochrome C [Geomonas sp. RF6]
MRVAKLTKFFSAFFLFCCIGTAWAAEPAAPAATTLSNADCVKCHEQPVKDITANGGKHKTEVTCQDCHNGHPPKVKKPIPACSQCHSGKPHYELKGCNACHSNPHTPKAIKFGNNVTDPCLTCHKPQMEQLKAFPSKHSKLACSFCHNVHGRIPPCTQCHKPHSADMTQKDCKACHSAHKPAVVTYNAQTPNKFCAACHSKAANLLASSPAKHNKLACVYCHQAKHKMVPACTSCHGTPHPAAMMAKFPKCSDCHSIAHDLNRWSTTGAPAKPAAPAAPAKGEAAPAPKKAPAKK